MSHDTFIVGIECSHDCWLSSNTVIAVTVHDAMIAVPVRDAVIAVPVRDAVIAVPVHDAVIAVPVHHDAVFLHDAVYRDVVTSTELCDSLAGLCQFLLWHGQNHPEIVRILETLQKRTERKHNSLQTVI